MTPNGATSIASASRLIFKAILDSDPPPAIRFNRSIPPKLEDIINKALEKDRSLRYQNAADMRTDLQRLKRDTDSGRMAVGKELDSAIPAAASFGHDSSRTMAASRAPGADNRKRWLLAAALTVTLAAVAGWHWWRSTSSPAEIIQTQLTENSSEADVMDAAISPDGKSLAYADATGLYLRLIPSGEIHSLPAPVGVRISRISWFPDNANLLVTAVGSGSVSFKLTHYPAVSTVDSSGEQTTISVFVDIFYPQNLAVLRKMDFFNSHAISRQLILLLAERDHFASVARASSRQVISLMFC